MKRLLAIAILVASAALFVAPGTSLACECYNSTGTAMPVSGDDACRASTVCGNATAVESATDPGICECGTRSETIDCSGICADNGYVLAPSTPTTSVTTPTIAYPTPQLNVKIPGVDFTAPSLVNEQLASNFIGTYVSGAFSYLLGFSMTVAIVFLMIGGVRYVIGGVSASSIKGAKKMMVDAIEGFVLLMFVYVILFTVNPATTLFGNLTLTVPPPAPYEDEDPSVSGMSPGAVGTPTATNVSGANKSLISAELIPDVDAAAATLATQGYGMTVTSAMRSLQDQLDQIKKNCQNPAGSTSCNHFPNRPDTCILKGMNPANCPHTTGRALDIWGTKLGSAVQCVTQSACSSDPSTDACRKDPCQAALISAMKAEGFCNSSSEAWHFEKPRMSSNCN